MSLRAEVDLDVECDGCGSPLDEFDRVYCHECATDAPKKAERNALLDKVRWIGDELRDRNVDWRIVERVREVEAELSA